MSEYGQLLVTLKGVFVAMSDMLMLNDQERNPTSNLKVSKKKLSNSGGKKPNMFKAQTEWGI